MSAALVLALRTDRPVCILIAHSFMSISQISLETSVLCAPLERLPCNSTHTNHEVYLSLNVALVLMLTSTEATKVLTKTLTTLS